MPRIRRLAALILVWFVSALAADQPPAPKPTIEELIEQLGDPSFQVRTASAKQIEALGLEALPALRKAQEHKDPEVRRRVAGWMPGLERASTYAPTYVSLRLTDRPVREAIDAIAKQTGFKLELLRDPSRDKELYSFELQKITFWEALDKIGEKTGVMFQSSYASFDDAALRLSYTDRYAPFVCRRGALRMVAQGSTYGRTIQFSSLPKVPAVVEQNWIEQLYLNIHIYAEPRLPLVAVGEPTLTEATDDQNRSLLLPPADPNTRKPAPRSRDMGRLRIFHLPTSVRLAPPARDARLIKVLKGTVPIIMHADQKALVVTDQVLSAKGKKFTAGSLIFDFKDVSTRRNTYDFEMQITKNGPHKPGWIDDLYARLDLQDEKGMKYRLIENIIPRSNEASIPVTLKFGLATVAHGKPAKLIFTDWATTEQEIPFEFKDLPLP